MIIFKKLLLLILSGFILSSCGEDDEKKNGEDRTQLEGQWTGFYKELRGETQLLSEVFVEFLKDSQFLIRDVKTEKQASGTFENYPRIKSLTLKITNSDISEFALKDSFEDYEYEIFPQELKLESPTAVYKLKRYNKIDAQIGLSGNWSGRDNDSRKWDISISKKQFSAKMKKEGAISVLMRGNVEYIFGDSNQILGASLMVIESQPRKILDALRVTVGSNDTPPSLTVQYADAEGVPLKESKPFVCTAE